MRLITTSVGDSTTGDTQCFSYDYLRRMAEAWTPAARTPCSTAPSTGALGGPAPYWQTYSYDASGNMLTRPGSTDDQTLTWNAEGTLTGVAEGTDSSSYLCDADGNRLITRDSSGSTLYLPGQELHYDPATGEKTGTRYYSYQGQTIAVRAHGVLTWLINDIQGTAQAQVADSLTQEPVWRRQDPFGQRRGTAPAEWSGHRGFVNGVQDDSGLTVLGAREYDPGLGRFVSDDPVTDPSNPQQLNGYAYANNSPVTFSDPDGNMFAAVVDEGRPCTNCTYNPGGSSHRHRSAPVHHKCGTWDLGCHVSQAAHATLHWAQQHPVLVSTVVSVAVGIGCEAAIGATGVGAVACAAAAGAVQEAVSYGLSCSAAHNCNARDLAVHTAVGALTGAAGGALGIAAGAGAKLLSGAAKSLVRKAVSKGADDVAEDVGGGAASRAASCIVKHSFAGGTRVLMADGSHKPIDSIKAGDKVRTSHHGQRGTEIHRVDRVIVTHTDHHYVALTVATPNGPRTLTTTTHHPFWDTTTDAWTQAAHLQPGDKLQTPTGTTRVLQVRVYTATRTTYDLTIHGLHTYYVEAGTTPILVHNCNTMSVDELANTRPIHGIEPDKAANVRGLSDDDLLNSFNNPRDDATALVGDDGRIWNGHHRINEIINRAADPTSSITGSTRVRVDIRPTEPIPDFW